MGVCDKLHKVYSNDLEPIVWARSVGVEVLNELDSLKAAMMITAGASGTQSTATTGWNLAATALQNTYTAVNTVSAVLPTVGKAVLGGVGRFLTQVSQSQQQR